LLKFQNENKQLAKAEARAVAHRMPELDDVRIEEDDKKDFDTEKSMLGKRKREDSSGDESPTGKMAHIFKEIVANANSDKLSL
jgi:hypothetical protein